MPGGSPWEQPTRCRVLHGGDVAACPCCEFGGERADRFGEGNVMAGEAQPPAVAASVEVVDGDGADAGKRLGVEQHETPSDPIAQLDAGVVEQSPEDGEALTLVEAATGPAWVAGDTQPWAAAGVHGPGEEVADGP